MDQELPDMSRDEALAVLKERWGSRWEIWCVPSYIPPDYWSARPWGAPTATVIAHSPADLHTGLTQAEGYPPGPV